jgi:hypothetical protein
MGTWMVRTGMKKFWAHLAVLAGLYLSVSNWVLQGIAFPNIETLSFVQNWCLLQSALTESVAGFLLAAYGIIALLEDKK